MDTTATAPSTPELEVLTDDELAAVIGGAERVTAQGAQDYVYNKIGMCGCGLAH